MDSFEELGAAIRSNATTRAGDILQAHPGLRARINDEMPGGHFGATALLMARGCGNAEMIDLLLLHGADINQKSHWWAGSFGVLDDDDASLVPFLIERGAVVDAYAAARHGMMERLRELVAAHPSVVRMRGGDGQTPLHVAKTVEVAAFLLDHGAEIDALDVDHESTPAQYLIKHRTAVARFLVERGARTDILLAAALGDLARVRRMLDERPEAIRTAVEPEFYPMLTDKAGGHIYIWTLGKHKAVHDVARDFGYAELHRFLVERTPADLRTAIEQRQLVVAAEDNDAARVRAALAAGAPVDLVVAGATALHWAAFHGNADLVRELTRRGAPLELRDRDFNATPLGWATHGSTDGWARHRGGDYAAAIEALKAAGATA